MEQRANVLGGQTTTGATGAWSGRSTHDIFAGMPLDTDLELTVCGCAGCLKQERCEAQDGVDPDLLDGETISAGVLGSLDDMADFLRIGFWDDGVGLRHNVGSSGIDPNNGVLHYNVTGTGGSLKYGGGTDNDGISEARAELVRDAFDIYGEVLGIDFVETTSTDEDIVDFFFMDNQSGAYAGSPRWGDGTIAYSYINVNSSWSGGTSTFNDYTLQTILHEIGHALGLGHQGDYNGSGGYESDADFTLDSWQATMMSYFSQTENTAITASYEFLQTPMAVDWMALDAIYGQFGYGTDNAFTGDTVYGFNTNIAAGTSRIWNEFSDFAYRSASTIIDAGGIDTIDFSGYSANQKIDLTVQDGTQTYQDSSDIGGRKGNLTLAVGTVIENAVGGSGDDTMIGNEADNVLTGNNGDDTFVGKGGDDTFLGGLGFDTALYSLTFGSYSFTLLDDAMEVIGEGIDLVYDTVESFEFSDVTYSFGYIYDLYSDANSAPNATDDSAVVGEGDALELDVLDNDTDADGDTLSITMIEGQAVTAGDFVTLASGAVVTLTASGTLDYAQNGAFDVLDAGQSDTDNFSYDIADGNGGTDTAQVSVTIQGADDATGTPIGESGNVSVAQFRADQWHSVTFEEEIVNAVVVMGPISNNDADAAITRLRNVTDTGFEFQIDKWEYQDFTHGTEDIGWLAISEGSHTLSSGQTIVASTESVRTRFSTVEFGETLEDAVVFAEVTTVNETNAVTTRIRRVDDTGFQVQVQEEEAGVSHGHETVSWIAIETGTAPGLEVVKTGDQLNQKTDDFVFTESFDAAPVLIADMQSRDGRDTAALRMTGLDETGVSMFVQEEQSSDSEVKHNNEIAGYVALNEGLIYDDWLIA